MTDTSTDNDHSKNPHPKAVYPLAAMCLKENCYVIEADQSIGRQIDPTMPVAERLALQPIDPDVIVDEIILRADSIGISLPKGRAKRELEKMIRDAAAEKRRSILMPICDNSLTTEEQAKATKNFEALAQVFDMPETLCVAAVKQLMWSVKRKQLRLPVSYPQMPIVTNRIQGSGKTAFVARLLGPLKELATDPVQISALTDPFGQQLMNYAVVNIDDAGASARTKVSVLKAIITNGRIQSRAMRKSRQDRREQLTTFIATTNEHITHLIPDTSGHRRFVVLPLKNGAVEKGGSADIWLIINSLDFQLMWRSVSHEAEEPIKAVLKELHAYQRAYVPPDILEQWVKSFDPNSEQARNIIGPAGITATLLYELYVDETGDEIGPTEFGRRLRPYLGQPEIPFSRKKRTASGFVYVLRR